MKLTDIKAKSDKELQTLVADTKKDLATAVVDMRTKKISNVKQIAGLKKTIARSMTEQRLRQLQELEESHG